MAEEEYELISAKTDVVFKMLFGSDKELLKDLISSLIDIPIEELGDLHYINPELPPDFAENKFSRLDLAIDVGNSLMNIEIQVRNMGDFRDRTLFYWAKLYTSELKKGIGYASLKKAVSINILDFNMFSGKNYHNEIIPTVKETGELFSDKLSMHFFELPKLAKKLDSISKKELWLRFIKATKKEEFDMLQHRGEPALDRAVDWIYTMSASDMIREQARLREKALHDEASLLSDARREGRAEGRVEGERIGISKGRAEMQSEILHRMKLLGVPNDVINSILPLD